jgi:thioredoxin reductase
MLWTTLAFLGFTALLVALHVRRSRPAAPAAPRARSCPRCRVVVPTGAAVCPKCGVPPQVFEVVAAPVAASVDEAASGRLHAAVRSDLCVGCGACVSVCPEAGALTMQGKLAVVDPEACKAVGECVKACPVNGIFLTTGAAVQRVEVPEVNFDFESNIPGVFVVGELGGRGLIKNAINEGKLAAEAVARRLRSGAAPSGSALVHDVVIVGSGPAGLSAALACLDLGLRYVVLEQGEAAESIRRYPRHKLLLAEPVDLPVYGDLWVADASKETLLGIWQNVITTAGLDIRTGQKVEDVKRESWGFHVVTAGASWPARHVILAMGRRGSPRKAGVPGEELSKVFYEVAEMEEFAGRRVLVVGGGDSAVESAIGLARQRGTTVHLSYRGEAFARVKDRNRAKLEEEIAAGRVVPLLRSTLLEIGQASVRLDVAGEIRTLPNDDVIVRIGGEPPTTFLDRVGVRRVVKEIAVSGVGA